MPLVQLAYNVPDEAYDMLAADAERIDSADLHYHRFIGSVQFIVGSSPQLTLKWDNVPVFDFLYAHLQIVASLTDGDTQVFDEADSDETLRYTRVGESVSIAGVSWTVEVSHLALKRIVASVTTAFLNEASERVPDLIANAHVRSCREQAAALIAETQAR